MAVPLILTMVAAGLITSDDPAPAVDLPTPRDPVATQPAPSAA